MRVMLINPYYESETNQRTYPLEPLGLLSIATYLKSRIKCEIKILDAHMDGGPDCILQNGSYRSGLSDSQIIRHINSFNPDVIGVSQNYSNNVEEVKSICELAKKSGALVVLGGPNATIQHQNASTYADLVVRSEGEETFFHLVKCLETGKPWERIPGITYRKDSEIISTPDRPFLSYDEIPIVDRSLIDYKKYLIHSADNYFCTKKGSVATLSTSRGCPFNCAFCTSACVWGREWRGATANRIFAEIMQVYNKYGVKEFAFQDDQFLFSSGRILDFCKLVIRSKMKFNFSVPSGLSPTLLNPKLLLYMKKAGFYKLNLSIDVGTNYSRNLARKPVNLRSLRRLVKDANSLGYWTHATLMVGFPWETESQIEKAKNFIYGLGLDYIRVYVTQPYPGSDISNGVEYQPSKSIYGNNNGFQSRNIVKIRDRIEYGYMLHRVACIINPVVFYREILPKIFTDLVYTLKLIFGYLLKKPDRMRFGGGPI